jgi:hypothetical protein
LNAPFEKRSVIAVHPTEGVPVCEYLTEHDRKVFLGMERLEPTVKVVAPWEEL